MTHDDDVLHQAGDSMTHTEHGKVEETTTAEPPPRKKARRGFAAMSAEKQKEIASLGGKAAHAKGTAHEFSPEEARNAGRKGGQAAQRARQATQDETKH